VPPEPTSRVWDAPVRLFHWLIVVLLGFSWWSGEQHEMEWHRWSGYVVLAALIFRFYWGFVGGRTARFAQFLRGPRAALAYARSLGVRPYAGTPGHNPIGGWSVVLMLATLTVMVVAGLFAVDVDGLESGPLSDYVDFDQGRAAAAVHHLVFNILLALVVLHVAAIVFYYVRLRHDLVTPMIHGRARVVTEPLGASGWKAALGILVAAVCTYAISRGLRF
jgi:cytochrome b